MKRLLVVISFIGIVCAAPAYADPPPCTAPAVNGLQQTPQCHDCVMAHLMDRDGLYRDCLGQEP